jgi:hypothetical protein
MTDPDLASPPERSPAAILEEHGRESVDRIIKIERWVRRVTYLTLGLVATTLITVVLGLVAFTYLLKKVGRSRYVTAVESCEINRKSTHDGLSELMVSLSKTPRQMERSRLLADQHFPYDKAGCEKFAADIGLKP